MPEKEKNPEKQSKIEKPKNNIFIPIEKEILEHWKKIQES